MALTFTYYLKPWWPESSLINDSVALIQSIQFLAISLIFVIMYLTYYYYEASRWDSNLGPKAFFLLEFEIAP